jgi:hypothetical protein
MRSVALFCSSDDGRSDRSVAHGTPTERLLLRELVDPEQKPRGDPISPRDGSGFVEGEVSRPCLGPARAAMLWRIAGTSRHHRRRPAFVPAQASDVVRPRDPVSASSPGPCRERSIPGRFTSRAAASTCSTSWPVLALAGDRRRVCRTLLAAPWCGRDRLGGARCSFGCESELSVSCGVLFRRVTVLVPLPRVPAR